MTPSESPTSVLGVALGMADADSVGNAASAMAAHPISKRRFIENSPESAARLRRGDNPQGTQGFPVLRQFEHRLPRCSPNAAWRDKNEKPRRCVRGLRRRYRRSDSYFLPVLRASFILSPGANSEAPLDMPVVVESFILSPGEFSEAPRDVGEVGEFELFI